MSLSTSRPANNKLGMLCMIIAMFTFALVNATGKDIAQIYSIWQITFFRFAFTLLPASFMIIRNGGFSVLKTDQLPLLGLLGTLGAFGVFILFTAFNVGRLADVTALAYSSILFLTALSVPLLKELGGWRRWLAVLIGFCGVILMASPDKNLQLGSMLGILFAFIDALMMILIRILTRKDKTTTVVFYFALFASVVSLPFMLPDFIMPRSASDLTLLAFLGIGGGIGQLFLTQAYKLAPAATVAPMIYTSMIWGALFGVFLFDEPITLNLITGGMIVVAASFYIIFRENQEQKKPPIDLIIE